MQIIINHQNHPCTVFFCFFFFGNFGFLMLTSWHPHLFPSRTTKLLAINYHIIIAHYQNENEKTKQKTKNEKESRKRKIGKRNIENLKHTKSEQPKTKSRQHFKAEKKRKKQLNSRGRKTRPARTEAQRVNELNRKIISKCVWRS